jgi:hypothetical protein
MLAGLRLQVNPADPTEDDNVTVPVNPLIEATVIVDAPMAPALTVTDAGLAVTVKSATVNVTVAEWDRGPLVPVTVTVKVPAGPVQDRVEV